MYSAGAKAACVAGAKLDEFNKIKEANDYKDEQIRAVNAEIDLLK